MSIPTLVGRTGEMLNHKLPTSSLRDGPFEERESPAAGHWLAGILVVGAFVVSLGGSAAAGLAYYAFPFGSALATIWILSRKLPYAYLTFTAWMWLLSPFVRRVVDWKYGYHASSIVLLAPALAGLLGIPVALRRRRRVDKTIGRLFVFAGLTFAYGALVGILYNSTTSVAVDILAIVGPFGAGLYALTVPANTSQLRKTLVSVAVWGTIVIGGYGIIQFLVLPAWDARWIVDSGLTTVGRAKAGQVRVFSTLNTSNPFGEVIAGTLLLALAERRGLPRLVAVALGLLSLGLSLVRAAWIAIAVGFAALMNHGRLKPRTILTAAAVLVVGLALFGGSITASVSSRVDKSVASGSSDYSLTQRLNFQRSIIGKTIENPQGKGMGATGTAARLGAQQQAGPAGPGQGNGNGVAISSSVRAASNFDSGILENATTYGSLLGFTLFFWLCAANASAWRRSMRGSRETAYFAATITLLLISMFFTNTLKNAPGFLLWILLAVCARAIPERTESLASPVPSSQLSPVEPR